MNEILVLAEHRMGVLRDVTFELLGMARTIAARDGLSVTALVLGGAGVGLAAPLSGAADRVLSMEADELADYNADPYLAALTEVIAARMPQLTMLAHTAQGMDLAPALAVRLGLPLTTDCIEVSLSDGEVTVLRQIYGGKLDEALELEPAEAYLVTVRPGTASADTASGASTEPDELAPADFSAGRGRRFLGYVEAAHEDVDIAAAPILVSVGRGLGKHENLEAIQGLAEAIGATISCSRPVADKGWLPKSRQVGTSGKVVRPKIYLALGISGAYQHVAGMTNAETIIAVNTDPAAPIFDVAHYGIVGDMFEVVEMLKQKLARA